jgi:inward rectifier potassium channel
VSERDPNDPSDVTRTRIVDRQGQFNVVRRGLARSLSGDFYHAILLMRWSLFLLMLSGFFLALNTTFALLYMAIPGTVQGATPGSFIEHFGFSVQTFSTIGYGAYSPATTLGHLLVTVEAFCGLISSALSTGMMFAKFAQPRARVTFSRNAIITSFNGVPTLMFRIANMRQNQIVDANLHVYLAQNEVTLEGERFRRFYDMQLVRERSALFVLTWTAMHTIDEHSPLYHRSISELESVGAEVIVSLMGIDGTFNQTIHTRYSYSPADLLPNHNFEDIISRDASGRLVVDHERFHQTRHDKLPTRRW